MGNVICTNCGMEASSKCPHCRTVFPSNQMDAMLSWTVKHWVKEENNQRWLNIQFHMIMDKDEIETEEQAWIRLHNLLKEMEERPKEFLSLKEFCCDHRWRFKEGQKSTIGCGHGS